MDKKQDKTPKYVLIIAALGIAAALTTFVMGYMNTSKQAKNGGIGDRFRLAELDVNKPANLDYISKNGNNATKLLASVKLADSLAASNPSEAIKLYNRVLEASNDDSITDLAEIHKLAVLINTSPEDANIMGMIESATRAGKLFRYSASELEIDYKLKRSQVDKAKVVIKRLLDDKDAPSLMKRRLQKLYAAL
jgi:hypothetical protein